MKIRLTPSRRSILINHKRLSYETTRRYINSYLDGGNYFPFDQFYGNHLAIQDDLRFAGGYGED